MASGASPVTTSPLPAQVALSIGQVKHRRREQCARPQGLGPLASESDAALGRRWEQAAASWFASCPQGAFFIAYALAAAFWIASEALNWYVHRASSGCRVKCPRIHTLLSLTRLFPVPSLQEQQARQRLPQSAA